LRLTALITICGAFAFTAMPALALEGPARDLAECEELSVEPAAEIAAPAAPAPEVALRVILPCAVAEHVLTSTGDLACADATLYVVTHAGTLLCEVDVPALVASSMPTVERAPGATLSASSAFSAAGLAPTFTGIVPPLVVDLPRAPFHSGAAPRDGFTRAPSVPS
jgi:hypothetical protein